MIVLVEADELVLVLATAATADARLQLEPEQNGFWLSISILQVAPGGLSHAEISQTQPVGVEAQTCPVGQVPLQTGALSAHGG